MLRVTGSGLEMMMARLCLSLAGLNLLSGHWRRTVWSGWWSSSTLTLLDQGGSVMGGTEPPAVTCISLFVSIIINDIISDLVSCCEENK